MKNIYLIPTDKPSRLLKTTPKGNLILSKSITSGSHWENQNIYITSSDEEIKEGDWFICGSEILKCIKAYSLTSTSYVKCKKGDCSVEICKKIILTTDEQLIKDGIQPIDDEFLEWFVKNPSCEEVEVTYDKDAYPYGVETAKGYGWYKIIIPSEELKQALVEMRKVPMTFVPDERMYSEEEVLELLLNCRGENPINIEQWFEQFKK